MLEAFDILTMLEAFDILTMLEAFDILTMTFDIWYFNYDLCCI